MADIIKAAENGEKLALLVAIRDKLAVSLEHTESGRDIAALTKRLIQVMDQIEEIESRGKPGRSKHDLLKAKTERIINGR